MKTSQNPRQGTPCSFICWCRAECAAPSLPVRGQATFGQARAGALCACSLDRLVFLDDEYLFLCPFWRSMCKPEPGCLCCLWRAVCRGCASASFCSGLELQLWFGLEIFLVILHFCGGRPGAILWSCVPVTVGHTVIRWVACLHSSS